MCAPFLHDVGKCSCAHTQENSVSTHAPCARAYASTLLGVRPRPRPHTHTNTRAYVHTHIHTHTLLTPARMAWQHDHRSDAAEPTKTLSRRTNTSHARTQTQQQQTVDQPRSGPLRVSFQIFICMRPDMCAHTAAVDEESPIERAHELCARSPLVPVVSE